MANNFNYCPKAVDLICLWGSFLWLDLFYIIITFLFLPKLSPECLSCRVEFFYDFDTRN